MAKAFTLIIVGIEHDKQEALAKDFAQTFSINPEIAQQILSCAPIVFVDDLTKQELRAITPKLVDLSSKGIEFRVTVGKVENLPKLNWPVRPQFTLTPIPRTSGLSFDMVNTTFICPNCGEAYLFKRIGKIKIAVEKEAPVKEEVKPPEPVKPAPVSAPQPPPVKPEVEEKVELPAPEEVPAGVVEEIKIEGVDELQPMPEVSDVEPLAEGISPLEIPEEVEAKEPETAAAPAPPKQAPAPAKPPAPKQVEPEPQEPPVEQVPVEEELYNVFLPNIPISKRDEAVKIISQIRGISVQEARKLVAKTVVPVLKEVPKSKADEAVNRLRAIKLTARITKSTTKRPG
jgi:ribosomal protein L7/L12